MKDKNLEFFKSFPNIEIRHEERLHAKYYENEFENIITSLNLSKFSIANNIEVGVRNQHASRGILGRQMEAANNLIESGIDKVKYEFLERKKEVDILDKFDKIFQNAELMYKTEPVLTQKGGISALFGKMEVDGFNVVLDKFKLMETHVQTNYKALENVKTTVTKITQTVTTEYEFISATRLSVKYKIEKKELVSFMLQKGLISADNKITDLGRHKGLIIRNHNGRDYIAYPINLPELNELKW